jgi:hypothetical protein
MTPSAAQRYEQALALHRGGRLDEADRLYREVLAEQPAHFGCACTCWASSKASAAGTHRRPI